MYAQSAGMANPGLMSAIAMAESGGNPKAHNAIPPDNSYGLWQVNMLGAMGPSRRAQYGISSNEQLFDPATNARAAAKILSSQGPQAWTTYTSGAYKKYIPKTDANGKVIGASWWDPLYNLDPFGLIPGNPNGSSPGNPFGGDPPYSGTADVATGIGGITEAVQKGGAWLSQPKHWLQVAYVLGGAVLAGMGLYIIASPVIGKVAASTPGAQAVKSVVGGQKKRPAAKAGPKKESSE